MESVSISVSIIEKYGSVRRALNKLAVGLLKDLKLGTKQVIVIREVAKRGEASITELAEAAVSDLAAVSRMINSLVKANWLTRSPHPEDGRQTVIRLGPKAKRKLGEMEAVVQAVAAAMTESLDAKEAAAFNAILTKIDGYLAKLQAQGTNSSGK